jgi:hypothetical protein
MRLNLEAFVCRFVSRVIDAHATVVFIVNLLLGHCAVAVERPRKVPTFSPLRKALAIFASRAT